MIRWTDLLYRLGGGPQTHHFDEGFFGWWTQQMIGIDDYAYSGMDFRGDSDMAGSTVYPASYADSGPMNEVSCTCHYICYFCSRAP